MDFFYWTIRSLSKHVVINPKTGLKVIKAFSVTVYKTISSWDLTGYTGTQQKQML